MDQVLTTNQSALLVRPRYVLVWIKVAVLLPRRSSRIFIKYLYGCRLQIKLLIIICSKGMALSTDNNKVKTMTTCPRYLRWFWYGGIYRTRSAWRIRGYISKITMYKSWPNFWSVRLLYNYSIGSICCFNCKWWGACVAPHIVGYLYDAG